MSSVTLRMPGMPCVSVFSYAGKPAVAHGCASVPAGSRCGSKILYVLYFEGGMHASPHAGAGKETTL
jgi:hypothetical protein